MIKVEVMRSGNMITGYKVEGHANHAPRGEDIVCAAVSMLAQSTLVGLGEIVSIPMQADVKEGLVNVHLDLSDRKLLEDAQVLLETMVLTVKTLIQGKEYSKYIAIDDVWVD